MACDSSNRRVYLHRLCSLETKMTDRTYVCENPDCLATTNYKGKCKKCGTRLRDQEGYVLTTSDYLSIAKHKQPEDCSEYQGMPEGPGVCKYDGEGRHCSKELGMECPFPEGEG